MFTNYTGLPAQHDQISSTLRQTLIAKTIRAYSCYTICPTTVISLLHIRSSNWKVVGCKGSRLSTVTIKYILYESIERQLMQAKVLLRRQFTLVQCSCCCLSPRYAIRNLDAPPAYPKSRPTPTHSSLKSSAMLPNVISKITVW